MPKLTTKTVEWPLASVALRDAYTDFVLSRQAMQCTAATMAYYQYTCGGFLRWLEGQGVTRPDEVTARHVRQFIAALTGKADTTIHDHARAIRTLLRFWHAENYMPSPVTFDMPRLAKKRLPVLTADELRAVLAACRSARDRALVLLMADSGLRRSEACALDWSDLDFSNGLLRVQRGKGNKARSAVIGSMARRALLAYRRTLVKNQGNSPVTLKSESNNNVSFSSGPMFLTREGARLKPWGVVRLFLRLSKRSGVHVTAHALRRTFTILSLRAGMSPIHLQALGGWSDLTMVEHYAQLEDVDLLQAHKEHSPIDRLLRPHRGRKPKRRRA